MFFLCLLEYTVLTWSRWIFDSFVCHWENQANGAELSVTVHADLAGRTQLGKQSGHWHRACWGLRQAYGSCQSQARWESFSCPCQNRGESGIKTGGEVLSGCCPFGDQTKSPFLFVVKVFLCGLPTDIFLFQVSQHSVYQEKQADRSWPAVWIRRCGHEWTTDGDWRG